MRRDEDGLSRLLNAHMGGDPSEMFCARCHRLRWRHPKWFFLALTIDRHFYRARGEIGHCRNAYLRERAERCEMVERIRMAGL